MLEFFTLETFRPAVGTEFRVGGGPVLVLAEASALPPRPAGREPFTLLFRGPLDAVLPQATYPLEHPALGAFELFVVPLGPDGGSMAYEAVFG